MTKRVGLKPLDEEYILMGMVAYGKALHSEEISREFLSDKDNLDFAQNLHTGVREKFLENANDMDIAASTQLLTEELIEIIMRKARSLGTSSNLVYGGGVALNCLAKIGRASCRERV